MLRLSSHPWLRKLFWAIYPIVVFVVLTVIRDLLAIFVHPYNIQFFNIINNNTASLNKNILGWVNSDSIVLGFTLIIVGLTASWYLNRTKDKVKNDAIEMVKKTEKEANERVKKAKDDAKLGARASFAKYLEFQTGKRVYVGSKIKIVYNQESIDSLIDQLPEELKDAAKEHLNNIS